MEGHRIDIIGTMKFQTKLIMVVIILIFLGLFEAIFGLKALVIGGFAGLVVMILDVNYRLMKHENKRSPRKSHKKI